MAGQQRAVGGDHLDDPGAEPHPDRDLVLHQLRPHRVAVALESHQGRRGHPALHLQGGRVRLDRHRQQRLHRPHLPDRAGAARERVGGLDAEPVEVALGVGDVAHGGGSPPALGGEAVAALHHPLAVASPRRADVDGHPIVLGHRCEAGQHRPGGRRADRRGPVEAPAPRRAAQAAQHPVDAVDERRLVLGVAEDPAHLAAVGQRADQQVGHPAPGRRQLQEVPLDLLAGGMADLDRRPAPDPRAGLAVRPQLAAPDRLGEARVRPRVTQPACLVPEGRRPDVRILPQPLAHVRQVRRQRVRDRPPALPRPPLAPDVCPDRGPAPTQVPGDG